MPERVTLALQGYRTAMRALTPLAPQLVARRLRHGKEDKSRSDERYGIAGAARPDLISHLVLWSISGDPIGIMFLAHHYYGEAAVNAVLYGMQSLEKLPAWAELMRINQAGREKLLAMPVLDFVANGGHERARAWEMEQLRVTERDVRWKGAVAVARARWETTRWRADADLVAFFSELFS